jgi:hypothetical protein
MPMNRKLMTLWSWEDSFRLLQQQVSVEQYTGKNFFSKGTWALGESFSKEYIWSGGGYQKTTSNGFLFVEKWKLSAIPPLPPPVKVKCYSPLQIYRLWNSIGQLLVERNSFREVPQRVGLYRFWCLTLYFKSIFLKKLIFLILN